MQLKCDRVTDKGIFRTDYILEVRIHLTEEEIAAVKNAGRWRKPVCSKSPLEMPTYALREVCEIHLDQLVNRGYGFRCRSMEELETAEYYVLEGCKEVKAAANPDTGTRIFDI